MMAWHAWGPLVRPEATGAGLEWPRRFARSPKTNYTATARTLGRNSGTHNLAPCKCHGAMARRGGTGEAGGSRGGSGMAPEVRPKPQITTRTNLDHHQEKIKPKSATNQSPPARYRTPKAQQDNKEVAFGTPEGRVFLPFMYPFMWEKPRNPRQVHLKIARFTPNGPVFSRCFLGRSI